MVTFWKKQEKNNFLFVLIKRQKYRTYLLKIFPQFPCEPKWQNKSEEWNEVKIEKPYKYLKRKNAEHKPLVSMYFKPSSMMIFIRSSSLNWNQVLAISQMHESNSTTSMESLRKMETN